MKFLPAFLLALFWSVGIGQAASAPASHDSGKPGYTIFPDKPKQTIKGIGFEIQCDSIGSGNNGLPEARIAVPHDLVPAERLRLADEMLKGFRYCRLAGGLYWRGLDAAKKQLQPRWPEQLTELKDLLDRAGVEGLSFEYWSPPPFWKANQSYIGACEKDPLNQLRCFAPGFEDDPIYHGDVERFLADFARAVVADIRTLKLAGLRVSMWGLQNEPFISNKIYSSCIYPDSANYLKAFRVVASAVRMADPQILICGDTEESFPKKLTPGMSDPEIAALVDAYVVHTIGTPSESVKEVHEKIRKELPLRPWFQNEYEYLSGPTSPDRCLNTVQHIMNSFQLAENPTWFWIHALKPFKNSEASGYSLGFWKSLAEPTKKEGSAPADKSPSISPGHWIYNPFNWNAVGSFVKHMPWDCFAVDLKEENYDADGSHPRVQTPGRQAHHCRFEPQPRCGSHFRYRHRHRERDVEGLSLHTCGGREKLHGHSSPDSIRHPPPSGASAAKLGVLGAAIVPPIHNIFSFEMTKSVSNNCHATATTEPNKNGKSLNSMAAFWSEGAPCQ